MRNWTPEQQQAIEARGASFLVSAAAGSGKTSVLVERLIRLLADQDNPVSAARMAVVTFTNDAAAEMKARLTQALAARMETEPQNKWLREQHAMLQCAKICTIHTFCFDLIRDHCELLDITPTFRILDETEETILRTAVLDQVLEALYADPDTAAIPERLCQAFCKQTDEGLQPLLLSLYEKMLSLPFGAEVFAAMADTYQNGSYPAQYAALLANEMQELREAAEEAVQAAMPVEQEKLSALLAAEAEQFTLLEQAVRDPASTPQSLVVLLETCSFATFPRVTKACPNPQRREFVKQLRDTYKKRFTTLRDRACPILQHSEEDLRAHAELLPILHQILTAFDAQLWAEKCERNAIGFGDAEQLALALLAQRGADGSIQKTALAAQLSDFYQILMLDEFQDTNNKQDLIFKLLSHGGTAERNGDNLFMVGDVKQSIYCFRLANPQNFLDTMAASVPYTERSTENACIRLNRNFRSSPEVISFVNFLFTLLMSETVGDVTYDAAEALIQGAQFANTPRDTEITLLPEEDPEGENSSAAYVADTIADMLRSEHPVSVSATETRPCRPKDFCILMRNKKNGAAYVEALAARSINAYSEEEKGYLKAREISLMLNLLRVIDSPPLDTAMAAVLLSPMFLFTMDEITQLRLLAPTRSLYTAICMALEDPEVHPVPPSLLQKAAFFQQKLAEFRMYALSEPLDLLIRRIYDSTDFLSVMQRYENPERKKANLRMLITYARSYETNLGGGISGFLRYIAQLSANGGDFAKAATVSGSEDVVSIKTIHKSKGLEFPFVFLVETDTAFNRMDEREVFQFNQKLGLGFRLQNRETCSRYVTLPFSVMQAQNHKTAVSEELRLLYVALTRAKDRLFLPLRIQTAEAQRYAAILAMTHRLPLSLIRNANSMGQWLLMALLTAENASVLRACYETADCSLGTVLPMQIHRWQSRPAAAEEAPVYRPRKAPDPDTVLMLQQRFAAFRAEQPVAGSTKESVSSLSKEDHTLDTALRRPRFMEDSTKLTGAERGTALHAFLQYADFAAAPADPEAEANRLVACGYLTPAQASAISIPALERFFASPLFARMQQATAVYRERKFLVRIQDLQLPDTLPYASRTGMLSGIIDLIFEEPDGLVLVDYKTDAVSERAILTERYQEQLRLYQYTLRLLYDQPVKETLLYAFHLGKTIAL